MKPVNKLTSIINEIRVNNAVVVIGAGVSFEPGMPLGNQLAPIVWEVVSSFPSIDQKFKGPGSTKSRIGEDFVKIKKAFSYIEQNENAISLFKSKFSKVNSKITVAPRIHNNIAKLVHENFFELIVSFNWDNLLEMSWSELYGTQINDRKINLIKPHGDVLKLNSQWVLPNSPGNINDEEQKHINVLAMERPRTLVIVGYSESDAKIVEELISPLEDKWKVYRVSPFSTDERVINLSASEFFEELVENLLEVNNYNEWEYLNFKNQNDSIGRAILGYKLTPQDVSVCPEMPQVQKATKILELNNFVILQGKPGSGKSISCYQIAFHFLKRGYEVLRFKTNDFTDFDNFSLPSNPKAIYIIDDGHILPNSILQILQEKSSNYQKIILTVTEDIEVDSATVSISNNENIACISEFYRKNEKTVSHIISKIDGDLGSYFMQESFDQRIDAASKEANLWTFNYVIRGGWKTTKDNYFKSKDLDNSQRLIFLLALKQIITKDNTVNETWLIQNVKEYFSEDEEWLNKNLKALRKKRLIDGFFLRMIHYEAAKRQLKFIFDNDTENRKKYEQIVHNEMISLNNPLLGKVWFMNTIFTSKLHFRIPYIISKNDVYHILEESLSSEEKTLTTHALYFANTFTKFSRTEYFDIYHFTSSIHKEIENVNSITAYSLGTIINDMYNLDKKKAKDFGSNLDITKIANGFSNLKKEDLYHWSYFISRLGLLLSIERGKEFFKLLDKNQIEAELLLLENNQLDFENLVDFIGNIFNYDRLYGIKLFHLMSDNFRNAFKRHSINAWHMLDFRFLAIVMGFNSLSEKRDYIKKDQRVIGEKIISFIEPKQLAEELVTVPFRSWHNLSGFYKILRKLDPNKYSELIESIDLTRIKTKFDEHNVWASFHSEILEFLFLYLDKKHVRTIDNFLYSNKEQFEKVNFYQFAFSPSLVKYYLENDVDIPLHRDSYSKDRLEWQALHILIYHLANEDPGSLRLFLLKKSTIIAEAISNFEEIDLTSINAILPEIAAFDREISQKIIDEVTHTKLYEKVERACNSKSHSSKYLAEIQQKVTLLYTHLNINTVLKL
ncbi:hypothetical protein [Planococcus sp. S3-L1]|uniref:nSTAND3 domain-containing NTPase n=1 Tax=Planococcus sp. S3-L1 TaxID=3046200 RepID=UPI0024BBB7F8|nr:hypothetical protein [Planococcus sp. S3-L1]MDJ0333024.1 hypothetical protein [Planococcus sp. S3-L1]